MDTKEFLNPGPEYRGVTLWMLNDELELEEVARQLEGFRAAGWGALITRTFVGLRTEYLGDEWVKVVEETIRLSGKLGLKVWLQAGYMPSGIPDLEPGMAHKVLVRKAKDEPGEQSERVLHEDDGHVYCERRLDHVLDLLSPEAVGDYLEKAYERPLTGRFGKDFGGTVEAIWVDEPHFRPPLLPWGDLVAKRFEEEWGYSITEHLPSLFSEAGDFRKVRHHYWRTVTGMFLDAYFAPVGRWCEEHKVKFSGHLMGEDTLNDQIAWTGAAMPCYEYMQLPGIDHLTMSLTWPSGKKFLLTPKQCASASNQLGRGEILSEMYGVSSQAITFEDRKQIGDWLAVLGINYRCYHGSFYSMRGRRKRIYVAHLSYQQPWWPDNRLVADYFARLSYALRQGTYLADVLVLHPVESAFCLYDPASKDIKNPHDRTGEPEDVKALDDCLVQLTSNLLKIHRGFEYGDETIMAKHAKVTEDGLSVGRMNYKAVVLPSLITLRRSTVELLERFAGTGGRIISVGDLPSRIDGAEDGALERLSGSIQAVENDPADLKQALGEVLPAGIELVPAGEGSAESVWVHGRGLDGRSLYFLTNTSRDEAVEVEVRIRGAGRLECWDLRTGEVKAAPQRREDGFVVTELSFAPLASHLLVLRENEAGTEVPREQRAASRVHRVFENGRLKRHSPNAFTLDCCRFRKGDAEWSERLPVICVQEMLGREAYRGPITLQFRFSAETSPGSISVVIEDAREYGITVNGERVACSSRRSDSPYYVDRSFHPVDVTGQVHAGENTIEIERDFQPVPKPGFGLASLFENISGVELESIYLIGDFAVKGVLSSREQKSNCVRYEPDFVLADEKETSGGDLLADGYPFFAGRMSLIDSVKLECPREGERVVLALSELHAALAKVRVNGKEAGSILWAPYEVDITSLVEEGDNEIEIEFVSTLRNLLGPHHRPSGEPDRCWGEPDFALRPEWLERPEELEANWTDDYFLVRFGIGGGAPAIEFRAAR